MGSYDLIIVGGESLTICPCSGQDELKLTHCSWSIRLLLASRLAWSLSQESVLLLDAGGNADTTHQSYGERHWTFMVA